MNPVGSTEGGDRDMGLAGAEDLTDVGSKPHLYRSVEYDMAEARSALMTMRLGGIRCAAFGDDLRRETARSSLPKAADKERNEE
jgi:hypothetical protein